MKWEIVFSAMVLTATTANARTQAENAEAQIEPSSLTCQVVMCDDSTVSPIVIALKSSKPGHRSGSIQSPGGKIQSINASWGRYSFPGDVFGININTGVDAKGYGQGSAYEIDITSTQQEYSVGSESPCEAGAPQDQNIKAFSCKLGF